MICHRLSQSTKLARKQAIPLAISGVVPTVSRLYGKIESCPSLTLDQELNLVPQNSSDSIQQGCRNEHPHTDSS